MGLRGADAAAAQDTGQSVRRRTSLAGEPPPSASSISKPSSMASPSPLSTPAASSCASAATASSSAAAAAAAGADAAGAAGAAGAVASAAKSRALSSCLVLELLLSSPRLSHSNLSAFAPSVPTSAAVSPSATAPSSASTADSGSAMGDVPIECVVRSAGWVASASAGCVASASASTSSAG